MSIKIELLQTIASVSEKVNDLCSRIDRHLNCRCDTNENEIKSAEGGLEEIAEITSTQDGGIEDLAEIISEQNSAIEELAEIISGIAEV